MKISIDASATEPVFSQRITQIREAVRTGELKPGTPLPPFASSPPICS